MQITGPAVWGEPAERGGAIAVLRCAVELGVDFIDIVRPEVPHSIAFIPWLLIARGELAGRRAPQAAKELGSSPAQLALAWLLRRSPVMLPIPGTSVDHLEANMGAPRRSS